MRAGTATCRPFFLRLIAAQITVFAHNAFGGIEMKTFALLATIATFALPGVAHATYMCDKMFAEKYGKNCPAGSSWDSSYHACIATGS